MIQNLHFGVCDKMNIFIKTYSFSIMIKRFFFIMEIENEHI